MVKVNDLISVIIPVYNVEKYLEKCINSVINQIYTKLEIILIDDGSTDNSGKICDEYCLRDNRIKVIHKQNGGLSSARNAGLDICRGNYVVFVDSDDFVSEDYVDFLYTNIIKSKKDISICGTWYYYENDNKVQKSIQGLKMELDRIETNKWLYIIGYYDVGVWNKMYKRVLFENIRFPVGKKSEDVFIQYKIIEKSNGAIYDSSPKYYYRQRSDSITKSTNINYDVLAAIKNAIDFYKKKNYNSVTPYAYRYKLFAYIGIYNACLCRTKDMKQAKKMRNEVFKLKKEINYMYLNKSRFIQLLLFIYCIPIYNIVFKIYYKKQKFY